MSWTEQSVYSWPLLSDDTLKLFSISLLGKPPKAPTNIYVLKYLQHLRKPSMKPKHENNLPYTKPPLGIPCFNFCTSFSPMVSDGWAKQHTFLHKAIITWIWGCQRLENQGSKVQENSWWHGKYQNTYVPRSIRSWHQTETPYYANN